MIIEGYIIPKIRQSNQKTRLLDEGKRNQREHNWKLKETTKQKFSYFTNHVIIYFGGCTFRPGDDNDNSVCWHMNDP